MMKAKGIATLKLSVFLILTFLLSTNLFASINPNPTSSPTANPQLISLNMQFKAKHKTVKSELLMPFYQTAELQKNIDNKPVLIEVNPRRGKSENEVAIEMKFYKSSGSKAYAKKEIIAKIGEESKISVKGLTVRVTPVL
jgi:hypothetical protein